MVKVRVPATSANMGAGFDTLGVALGLYTTLEIEETESGLEITAEGKVGMPAKDDSNLVYRAMTRVFNEVGYSPAGIRINEKSNIPMTRGLGSSSACIVGGMFAANEIADAGLARADILDMAAAVEGHPDNITPAVYGGFCVAAINGGHVLSKSIKLSDTLTFAVMVPDFQLSTKSSRHSLPDEVDFSDAVGNISASAIMQAALVSGDYDMLRFGVRDRLHQKYRKGAVEGFDEILRKTYLLGAKATYLSGSGPTLVSILTENEAVFEKEMRKFLASSPYMWSCRLLKCDNDGAVIL